LAVDLTLELGDAELLLCDQSTVFRALRARDRKFGGDLQSLRPFGRQGLLQSDNVLGHGGAISIHTTQ
jgi:hypothetical protein